MANNIMVERETFESNGKTYFGYFIRGVVRGKDIRIQIVRPTKIPTKAVTTFLTSYSEMQCKQNSWLNLLK